MFARALFLVTFASVAVAADPPKSVPALELDKTAEAVLKDVHDRGADLYNAADAGGALRLYEGMLRSVGPFLAHRPAVQKAIDDGLTAAGKLDGAKAKAYRLHELIEQIRADLKADAKKPEAKPADPPKAVEPPKLPNLTGKLTGTVTLDGQPLATAAVMLVTLDLAEPKVFTAATDAAGKFALAGLPAGKYSVTVDDTGGKVPAKYQTTRTSGFTLTVKAGDNTGDLRLESK